MKDIKVKRIMNKIDEELENNEREIIVEKKGEGKKKMVKINMMGEEWRGEGVIVIMEKRRIDERDEERRMEKIMGEEKGEKVG